MINSQQNSAQKNLMAKITKGNVVSIYSINFISSETILLGIIILLALLVVNIIAIIS